MMEIFFDDTAIATIISAPKLISSDDYDNLFHLSREKKQHKEKDITIPRDDESSYKLIIRSSKINPLDFSVILALCFSDSNRMFKLRRYNGKSHRHRNKIEDQVFYDFHVHEATERYQRLGVKEEYFAQPTSEYSDLTGAIRVCMKECNIAPPSGVTERLL
jgi:hypothetical protein